MVTAHILGEVGSWLIMNKSKNFDQIDQRFYFRPKLYFCMRSPLDDSYVCRFCKHHLLILNITQSMKWISMQLLIGSKYLFIFILPHVSISLQYLSLRYCYEKNNVVVLRKKSQHTWWITQHNGNANVVTDCMACTWLCCSFMGRGVVDSPLKEVAEFYKDIQSTFLWDHLLVVSSSLVFRHMHVCVCIIET